jgi:hypothetical protein
MQESSLDPKENPGVPVLQLIDSIVLIRWLDRADRARGPGGPRAGATPAGHCGFFPTLAAGLSALALAFPSFSGRAVAATGEESLAAVANLGWMAGCWSGHVAGVAMEECWTAPGGGMLLGMHRDINPSGRASFEFLRIEATGDSVAYWGSPMGKTPTPFRLKEQGPNRVVFENLNHDFPQRILYWLEEDRILCARVEGMQRGAERREEWQWRRAVVPPAAGQPAR